MLCPGGNKGEECLSSPALGLPAPCLDLKSQMINQEKEEGEKAARTKDASLASPAELMQPCRNV